jgi:hypothetical protein
MYPGPCTKNKLRPRLFFSSGRSVGGVWSCTVISRRHTIVQQKKCNVRSDPLSVEVWFRGRVLSHFGQGCPPPYRAHPCTLVVTGGQKLLANFKRTEWSPASRAHTLSNNDGAPRGEGLSTDDTPPDCINIPYPEQ